MGIWRFLRLGAEETSGVGWCQRGVWGVWCGMVGVVVVTLCTVCNRAYESLRLVLTSVRFTIVKKARILPQIK